MRSAAKTHSLTLVILWREGWNLFRRERLRIRKRSGRRVRGVGGRRMRRKDEEEGRRRRRR